MVTAKKIAIEYTQKEMIKEFKLNVINIATKTSTQKKTIKQEMEDKKPKGR